MRNNSELKRKGFIKIVPVDPKVEKQLNSTQSNVCVLFARLFRKVLISPTFYMNHLILIIKPFRFYKNMRDATGVPVHTVELIDRTT